MYCYNLRNKQYCIGNKQFTKDWFELQKKIFDYSTFTGYQKCQTFFQKILREKSFFRALSIEKWENVFGNYLEQVKNGELVFFANTMEDVCNIVRGVDARSCLDALTPYDTEKQYMCCAVQLKCYDVRFSFQLTEARFVDYSAYSSQLENCFWCCGLVRAKNCVMNTPYSVQEYSSLKQKMIDHMKSTGEWGQFFPGSFAPNPYDESWSSFYFPLSQSEQKKEWYFYLPNPEKLNASYLNIDQLPSTPDEANESTTKLTFWDSVAMKPFQILPQDINLCRELKVALPHTHYIRRIQENFRWMPYNGTLRTTKCAKSWKEIQTSWPSEYDGRIVSEEEYLKIVQ
jgi:hypothetical protein